MYGDSNRARAGTTLSVEELEEKLRGLHDYLSSPYRARAEAVVLRRRQREAAAAEEVANSRTPQPTTAPPVPPTPPQHSPTVSPSGAQDPSAAPSSVTADQQTHAYVQRLEWQVVVLAEALAAERQCVAEMKDRVVQPLLVLSEAALRRQAALECELAMYRETRPN